MPADKTLERTLWLTVAAMVVSLPLLGWWLWMGFRTTHNSPIGWLPDKSRATGSICWSSSSSSRRRT